MPDTQPGPAPAAVAIARRDGYVSGNQFGRQVTMFARITKALAGFRRSSADAEVFRDRRVAGVLIAFFGR
jgi:hypothetical protein